MLGCIAMEFHEGTDAAECDIAHSLLLGEAQGMLGTCMHMLRANTAAALTSGWMACSSRLSSSNASPSICAHHSTFSCKHVGESLFVSTED